MARKLSSAEKKIVGGIIAFFEEEWCRGRRLHVTNDVKRMKHAVCPKGLPRAVRWGLRCLSHGGQYRKGEDDGAGPALKGRPQVPVDENNENTAIRKRFTHFIETMFTRRRTGRHQMSCKDSGFSWIFASQLYGDCGGRWNFEFSTEGGKARRVKWFASVPILLHGGIVFSVDCYRPCTYSSFANLYHRFHIV